MSCQYNQSQMLHHIGFPKYVILITVMPYPLYLFCSLQMTIEKKKLHTTCHDKFLSECPSPCLLLLVRLVQRNNIPKKKESNLNEQCFSVFLPHMLASLIADGSAGSVIIITIVCSLIMHRSAAAFHFCCSCIPTLWGWNRLSCFSSYYYFAHFYY